MKAVIITLALAALVSSQSLPTELPDCAKSCALLHFTSNGSSFADCDSKDVSCICSNGAFVSSISCCIFSNCNTEDQEVVVEFAQNLCSQVVIPGTPDLPSSASCPAPPPETDTDTATDVPTATAAPTAVNTQTSIPAMTTASVVYKIRGARY
ncbi:uncharacterized protein BP5553_05471 [Venustampulla echinocandica]|uniref:CFEM domain-containing protein n=1 Tax=Venustampulla echinocandica TaxID=2656787 RepID=A0A370TRA8_9HELO|nr:uncharacterized protein BP5553_05471 [Venustampulla echinocandica]RDL38038.1 hypothetical protein BP5553_05471 [Venustampulla echinocandica]